MSDERFQVIVIGAGPAGSSAAYRLAKAGYEVLLIERGKVPGSKNVSGGRLYSYALETLMPGEWQDAPFERDVVREVITVLTAGSSISLDCKFSNLPPRLSYTVLRAKLDSWLAKKAEEAGAMLITGTKVDSLIVESGRVCGVQVGEEVFFADIVICADGVNSVLAQKSGYVRLPEAKNMAIGVKQIISLPEETINERFNVKGNQGAGLLLMGACTNGVNGGGFLYTNRDSVSLGIVVDTLALKKSNIQIADIIEDMKLHPYIASLISGGEVSEYSAHLIPEGGINAVPKLYADGLLIAGDAAGLVINNGFTVRGMDYAIMSGIAAADTASFAIENNCFSESILQKYAAALKSGVLYDMETFKNTHNFMVSTPELYSVYPEVLEAIMKNIFTITGTQSKRLPSILRRSISNKVSVWKLLKDGAKGATSL